MQEIREWVRQALAESGLSMSEMSRRLGIPVDGISKVLKGRRELSAEEMFQIQNISGVAPPANASGASEIRLTDAPAVRSLTLINVIGEAAGGVWKEMKLSFDEYTLNYPIDPRFPPDALKALRISGNSINRQAKDGDHVVILDVWAFPRELRDGDWVAVRRIRHDVAETTVKQLRGAAGAWELWPDSTDPDFQTPVSLAGNGPDDIVEVFAVVLDFIRPATRV